MSNRYDILNRATVAYDYLKTNATTHQYAFCAMAELCDNARDAQAENLHVYTERNADLIGGFTLSFLDDGEGMSPKEAADVMSFGMSSKKAFNSNLIGQYGNGLKSGTMRLGFDFVLFTKKKSVLTVILVSRTFHENEKIYDRVIYPMPSFDGNTHEPLINSAVEDREFQLKKHKMELDLILKYSPYETEDALFKEFSRISGQHGTLVTIYNMRLNAGSEKPELDIQTSTNDILIATENDDVPLEQRSFRAYTTILYSNPRMKIYIQGSKVRTKLLEYTLYEPRCYMYLAKSVFKKKAEIDLEKAKEDMHKAEQRHIEAKTVEINLRKRIGDTTDKEKKAALRIGQEKVVTLKEEFEKKKEIYERKKRSLNEPKELKFKFGINLQNKSQDGLFIYNCNRLIVMSEKPKSIQNNPEYDGIVGVVDVPYEVLEPAHNKQQFSDATEHQKLSKTLVEHMKHYVEKMKQELRVDSMRELWKQYGYYVGSNIPSDEFVFKKKRFFKVNLLLQCDECLKWRQLPSNTSDIDKVFPDKWCCENMTNSSEGNCCTHAEKLRDIEFLNFKKEIKPSTDANNNVVRYQAPIPKISQVSTLSRDSNSKSQVHKSLSSLSLNQSQSSSRPALNKDDFYKSLTESNKKPQTQSPPQSRIINEPGIVIEIENDLDDFEREISQPCTDNAYIDNFINDCMIETDKTSQNKRVHTDDDEDDENDDESVVNSTASTSKSQKAKNNKSSSLKKNRKRVKTPESASEDTEYIPTSRSKFLQSNGQKRIPRRSADDDADEMDNYVPMPTNEQNIEVKSEPREIFDPVIHTAPMPSAPHRSVSLNDDRLSANNRCGSQTPPVDQPYTYAQLMNMVELSTSSLKLVLNAIKVDDEDDFSSMSPEDLLSFDVKKYIEVYRVKMQEFFQNELDRLGREFMESFNSDDVFRSLDDPTLGQ